MHRRASPAWWTLWKGTKKCGGGTRPVVAGSDRPGSADVDPVAFAGGAAADEIASKLVTTFSAHRVSCKKRLERMLGRCAQIVLGRILQSAEQPRHQGVGIQ